MNEIQNKEVYQGLNKLYANVTEILANARKRAYSAVNFSMVESYWLIGQQIVEHEQHGEARADYGKGLLKELAARLTIDFGKGFDERELRKMRQFYQTFQKRDTLRPELTWSHYGVTSGTGTCHTHSQLNARCEKTPSFQGGGRG